jgi:hypothetical protein
MVREKQEWWRALIHINKFSACLSAVYKVSIKKKLTGSLGLGAGLLVLLMIFYVLKDGFRYGSAFICLSRVQIWINAT